MANYTMFRSQRMLLAGFLAGVFFFARTNHDGSFTTKTRPRRLRRRSRKTAAGCEKRCSPGADNTEGQSELRDRRGSGQQAQNGTD